MRIRTPADLGALIRDHRTRLGLDQKSLAQKVGFSRQWIVEVEKGKPRAASGLLLRTVDALGLLLDADKPGRGKPSLRYNEAWRTAADVYPLSISMPLPFAEHGNAKIDS